MSNGATTVKEECQAVIIGLGPGWDSLRGYSDRREIPQFSTPGAALHASQPHLSVHCDDPLPMELRLVPLLRLPPTWGQSRMPLFDKKAAEQPKWRRNTFL